MTSGLVGLRSQQPQLGNSGWQNFCRRAINAQLTFCHCTGGFLRQRVFSSEMHGLTQSCSGSGTERFYDYIWDMHSSFPQFPIWITEYADLRDNKTGGFLFNKAILRGGLSYYSCALIRGLGFHESNYQLSGFIGLDWTLCVVRFLRELSNSIGVQCSHTHTFISQRSEDNVNYSKSSILSNKSFSNFHCRHAWGRWQPQWSRPALHWSWYHPYISKKLRNKPTIPDHQSLGSAWPTSRHIMAEGDQ